MALNNGDPAPVVVRTDCIVLTGGHLKAKHDISVPVRTVGPLSFWVLHTHCEKASLLFTGVPACKRPLCKLTVFDMLRKKIAEKRDEAVMSDKEKKQADQEDAEEARFSFGGEECEDVQTPQKHKRQRTNARKVGQGITSLKPVVTVSVPSFFRPGHARVRATDAQFGAGHWHLDGDFAHQMALGLHSRRADQHCLSWRQFFSRPHRPPSPP